jgi:hypothetical protein
MDKPIPYYDAQGRSLGFRTPEAARRLIRNGFVTAARGRKGHLKAIFGRQADGAPAVEADLRLGTCYSYREHLDSGHFAWRLKRLGKGDELRPLFLQVVTDCVSGA